MPSIPHLIALPPELLNHVLSLLPRNALLQSRLVNRHLNYLVTPNSFRPIRLEAYGDSPASFRSLADPKLHVHIQDVAVDTWLGPDFEYRMRNIRELPEDFVNCFPFLSCFRSLESLHLRFHEDCAEVEEGDVDESNDDRVSSRYSNP